MQNIRAHPNAERKFTPPHCAYVATSDGTGDTMKKITLLAAAAVFTFGIAAASAQGTGGAAGGGSPGTGSEKAMKNAEQPGTTSGTTMQAPAPAPSGTTAAAPKE